MRWVLDTDHLSLLFRRHSQVVQTIAHYPPEEIAITVITAEEQLRGRLSMIRQAAQVKQEEALLLAYRQFRETLADLSQFYILDFTSEAVAHYQAITQKKPRVGTQDLRIAAIALSLGATVVTRNQRDFSQIDGLQIADWTIAP